MRKKNSAWQILGALGAIGYLGWQQSRDNKRQAKLIYQQAEQQRMRQENFYRQQEQRRQQWEQMRKEKEGQKHQVPPKEESPRQERPKAPPPNPEEIKALYYMLVKKYHPDHAVSDIDKKLRTELTTKINLAYKRNDLTLMRILE